MRLPHIRIALALVVFCAFSNGHADSIASNPIVFVTMVPNPDDFGTLAATFGNHIANPDTAFRGGDLWIRYPDGSLKNLTQAAGFGSSGFQGAGGIAVRDPSVHWDGTKVLFSMVVGAPTQQYQVGTFRWQLYEITGLGSNETPVITKVPNQPSSYNNIAPIYGSDDSIIFVSDRPRDDSVLHTYPQRDEYESSPVNSGLWKLNTSTSDLILLDHSPSGDFNPSIDSFGRVIFTRWDHLQRDQQNVGVNYGAVNYASEESDELTSSAAEVFPEPRSSVDPDRRPEENLHTINQFFPWMMNQDGTDLETLNHVGRQEIGVYSDRSFNNDSNLEEFYSQYTTGINSNSFEIFLHIREDPTHAGTYLGTNCQEFATHAAGQILSITGAPGLNPDQMQVTYLTHPDTAAASESPSVNHTGLYRDPLPLTNGKLLASHTTETREDANTGTSASPGSRYAFRLKLLEKQGSYFRPTALVTDGISKSVSFWNPDTMVSYNGPLWEMMAVELVSRSRPNAGTQALPSIEQAVFDSLGISVSELRQFLETNNLALVVGRNMTTRDRNDHQQPMNLRVEGGGVESIPHAGTVYDIAHLEFFQGDLLRGYDGGSRGGRRVLAQRMHSVAAGVNPALENANVGAVQIAEDGSMAAFVPARRALSWQLASSSGAPVVRERYWLTFQPGEIRVCASCHGVNTADQMGNTPPTNSPVALTRLLSHWKNLPPPTVSEYRVRFDATSRRVPRGKFTLTVQGAEGDDLSLRVSIQGRRCAGSKKLSGSATTRSVRGQFPKLSRVAIGVSLHVSKGVQARASTRATVRGAVRSPSSRQRACRELLRSLR